MFTDWEEHKHRLGAYIARQIDDPATVDDILQDVWLKAHEQISQLRNPESLGAWLYRIAYNAIMDHHRQQRPTEELSVALTAPEQNQTTQAHQELALCLKPLMEELPEKYRTPLQLSEIDGLSQQQVADQLQLSLSGAKSRIQRGRARLRDHFTACCDIDVGRGEVLDYQPKNSDCKEC